MRHHGSFASQRSDTSKNCNCPKGVEEELPCIFAAYQQRVTPVLGPGPNSAPTSIKDTQLLLQGSLTPFHQSLERGAAFGDALQISFPPLQLSQHILKQDKPLTLHTAPKGKGDRFLPPQETNSIIDDLHLRKIKPRITFCLYSLSVANNLSFLREEQARAQCT